MTQLFVLCRNSMRPPPLFKGPGGSWPTWDKATSMDIGRSIMISIEVERDHQGRGRYSYSSLSTGERLRLSKLSPWSAIATAD